MRTLALTVVTSVGLAWGSIASAEQFTDPNGRLTVNVPAGWRVQQQNVTGFTAVLAFNPSSDCYFFGVPNPNTTNSSSEAVHNSHDPLASTAWTAAANVVGDFFPGNSAQLVSQSVDTSGFWPVQRAELRGPSKTVFAAVQARPGMELRAFCAGAESASAYDAIFASLGHPNDATWQAQAEQAATERAAAREAAAANAAAQQNNQNAAQEQQHRRRGR